MHRLNQHESYIGTNKLKFFQAIMKFWIDRKGFPSQLFHVKRRSHSKM